MIGSRKLTIGLNKLRGATKTSARQTADWDHADSDEVLPQQVTYYELSAARPVHWDRVTLVALAFAAVVFWGWGQHHNAQVARNRMWLEASTNGALRLQHTETVALAALPVARPAALRPSASFTEPVAEATVGATLTVRGTVRDVPEGKHLWLVTRRDPRLGFWPKERVLPADDGSFEHTTWDYGADGPLSICVLSTNASDTQRFEDWLAVGDREDEWPSVQPTASSSILGCQEVTLAKHWPE